MFFLSACTCSQAVAQGAEDSLLSTLDIVKHAIRTVLHTAGELDRVALITYADSAKVVCDLTVMNAAGRARALSLVDTMVAAGRTNLWDGLLKSLQVLDTAEKQADTIAGGAEGAAAGAAPVSPLFLTRRNASIMLLTDGEPNIEPPRGHLPTLRRYMEQRGGRLPAVLSTFGFGYSLDSHLLRELAVAGS